LIKFGSPPWRWPEIIAPRRIAKTAASAVALFREDPDNRKRTSAILAIADISQGGASLVRESDDKLLDRLALLLTRNG